MSAGWQLPQRVRQRLFHFHADLRPSGGARWLPRIYIVLQLAAIAWAAAADERLHHQLLWAEPLVAVM